MSVLFVPIVVLLYFVVTMQRTRSGFRLDGNENSLLRSTRVSYWGGTFRWHYDIFDLLTGEETRYKVDAVGVKAMDGGRALAYLDETNRLHVISHGTDQMMQPSRVADKPADAHEAANGLMASQLVGDEFVLGLGFGDFLRWNRKTNEIRRIKIPPPVFQYWDGESVLACVIGSDVVRAYRIANGRFLEIGQTTEPQSNAFFENGEKYLRSTRNQDSHTWQIVETSSGESIARLPRVDGLWGWQARGDKLIAIQARQIPGGMIAILSLQQYDPETLQPVGDGILLRGLSCSDAGFNRDGGAYFVQDRSRVVVHVVNLDKQTASPFVVPEKDRWWWPLRWTGIALAAIWWLAWSVRMRRDSRSFQPVLDIAILHAVFFVCFGGRLYGHMNGPLWNHALHSWESVTFLGTGASFIGWMSLWIVFGPQRGGLRVGAIGVAFTLAIGFVLVIWDLNAVDFDASLARAGTLVGVVAHVVVVLLSLWILWVCGLRLHHRTDEPITVGITGGRFSLLHMIGWTAICALLFVVLGLRRLELPNEDELMKLIADGFAGGLANAVVLWLGLGKSVLRYPFAAIGLCLSGLTYWAIGWLYVAHVGAALIPILLVSSLTFRWNGYCLQRPI
ncbi:MAG: hypothetical protein AAFX06_02635 [Planctomycetota bacterium]